MRKINEIIIHCSATRPDQDINAETIDKWHKKHGWTGIGYHFFIRLDGTVESGRPIKFNGAHTYGHNANTIGICYAGGIIREGDKIKEIDTRTKAQIASMHNLVKTLLICFPSIIKISGHNQYANKKCPCFDVPKEFNKYLEYGCLWEQLRANEAYPDIAQTQFMW